MPSDRELARLSAKVIKAAEMLVDLRRSGRFVEPLTDNEKCELGDAFGAVLKASVAFHFAMKEVERSEKIPPADDRILVS
jgi:hypothetical protein